MLCNGNGVLSHLQMEIVVMGFVEDSITPNTMHENTFSAPFKVFYVKQPPNGVLPFANCHFQIGIIIMGITEHFGPIFPVLPLPHFSGLKIETMPALCFRYTFWKNGEIQIFQKLCDA